VSPVPNIADEVESVAAFEEKVSAASKQRNFKRGFDNELSCLRCHSSLEPAFYDAAPESVEHFEEG